MRIADEHLQRVLDGLDYLVQDGAMGTMLQARGIVSDQADKLCLEQPEAITSIHRAYVEAGAEMVVTNTFGANSAKLGSVELVEQVYAAAEQCARAAGARYVAGDIGPTGQLIEPLGPLSFDDAYRLFAEQARAIAKTGCDLVVIETMADLREAKAALLAVKDHCDVPVIATMTYASGGKTFLGVDPVVAVATLEALGADIVGMNCSLGPDAVLPIVKCMNSVATRPVEVRPNAGLPNMVEGSVRYDVTPELFAQSMEAVLDAGVHVVGGCCGTSPDHIAALAKAVQKRLEPREEDAVHEGERGAADGQALKRSCMVACDVQASFALDEPIVVAGFSASPDTASSLDEMLQDDDMEALVDEVYAARDEEAGAFFFDFGATACDDAEHLREAVAATQESCPMPLIVRTPTVASLKAVLSAYSGRPAALLPEGVSGDELASFVTAAARLGVLVIVPAPESEGRSAQEYAEYCSEAVLGLRHAGCDEHMVALDFTALTRALDADGAVELLAQARSTAGAYAFISDVGPVAEELADAMGWEPISLELEGEELELSTGVLF